MTQCNNCDCSDERVKLRPVRSTGGVESSVYLCIECARGLRRKPGIKSVRWRRGHTADDVKVDDSGERPTLTYDHFKRRGVSGK